MKAKYPGTCSVCGARFPAGTEIAYEAGAARHATCTPFVPPADAWTISEGAGYGGSPYIVGDTLFNPKARSDPQASPYLRVLHATSRYYAQDGYSFGVGDEQGYVYSATVRVATEEESAPLRAHLAAMQTRLDARKAAEAIALRIKTEGEFVAHGTAFPEGEGVFDFQDIHGSGTVFMFGPHGVWYLERHMMDGDDWLANNVGGTHLGWYLPDPTLIPILREHAAAWQQSILAE